jgi:hypothetical protein
MDNFDLRKYLIENKVTTNSRMLSEADDAVIPTIKETAALLKQEDIPFEMVSFQDMEADLQHGMDVEGDTSKGVIKLDSKKGTIYIAEYGYNSISISGKNVEDEDDYVTNSPEEMVQTLKQDFLNESSEMMKEYFEKETQTLKEAFAQAGIDMNKPVEVVRAGGGPGGSMEEPKEMNPKALLQMLEKEKAEFEAEADDFDAVTYDFDAGEFYPGAKLAVMFSDAYEYTIFQ